MFLVEQVDQLADWSLASSHLFFFFFFNANDPPSGPYDVLVSVSGDVRARFVAEFMTFI